MIKRGNEFSASNSFGFAAKLNLLSLLNESLIPAKKNKTNSILFSEGLIPAASYLSSHSVLETETIPSFSLPLQVLFFSKALIN